MVRAAETKKAGAAPPARIHQPDQDRFHAIRADDIKWTTFDAYTIRVKVPGDVKMMPHKHPEDRIYTVISGVFYIGLGEEFDESKLVAYAPGSVVILPGNQSHFHWARSGEYISQVTATGPLGMDYVDPHNDPRVAKRH
jgi:quercetin dioxygenase-like cupin family protein